MQNRANLLALAASILLGVAVLLSCEVTEARFAVNTHLAIGSVGFEAALRLWPGPRDSGTAAEG